MQGENKEIKVNSKRKKGPLGWGGRAPERYSSGGKMTVSFGGVPFSGDPEGLFH